MFVRTVSRGEVTVLLFGPARQDAGIGTIRWPVPSQGITARALIEALRDAYPRLGATLRVSRFVRNGVYLDELSARIRGGDEFAVHPPYGGG